ncbi:hydroxyacid dehydrogenase [Phytoactinopolyspora alkaliphila]|uniref:Hydroxyacid dehydrogenase n=1 Tax=Phytoactinopolyspora alkaliphila TaxID=1783498 RepID=A0A6N9YMD9_9ACTN|nr:hydroxyacid dehydrogenase [Phytoactinopolyspora alkaliphila]NED96115.1 hydroxyacid dehydrogenase [Phytoactinopolyspora alkaliphila]
MSPEYVPSLFPPETLARLRQVVDIDPARILQRFDEPDVQNTLAEAQVLITGWGCPRLDADALERLPKLRAAVHAAGSVKGHATPVCWERGIAISSAADANAAPVAEYTLAAILFAGKGVFEHRERYRRDRVFTLGDLYGNVGNYGRRVGIIGASRIGRRVIELLRPFDFDVSVHDPYLTTADAAALGVRAVSLDELVATSDIVSVHAPATPSTRHMLDRKRLAKMPDGAILVNTARGSLVDTAALTGELVAGRLSAVLDVTDPEPLPAGSPLFTLPNVFLTPHIAGSQGNELARIGRAAADEVERFCLGRPLRHAVALADLETAA